MEIVTFHKFKINEFRKRPNGDIFFIKTSWCYSPKPERQGIDKTTYVNTTVFFDEGKHYIDPAAIVEKKEYTVVARVSGGSGKISEGKDGEKNISINRLMNLQSIKQN